MDMLTLKQGEKGISRHVNKVLQVRIHHCPVDRTKEDKQYYKGKELIL